MNTDDVLAMHQRDYWPVFFSLFLRMKEVEFGLLFG
jgi:hypothetical protein